MNGPAFGWHEIATKSDLRSLESNLDHRFSSLRDGLRVEFMHQTNRILMWTVTTVVAGMGAAIVAIVAVGS